LPANHHDLANTTIIITDQERYFTIERDGFHKLVLMRDGQPAVVDNPQYG